MAHCPSPFLTTEPTSLAAWQVAPGCAGSQDPEDAVEDTTVVHTGNAARLVRQQRFDGGPLVVGEFIAHDSSPQLGLNHRMTAISTGAPVELLCSL